MQATIPRWCAAPLAAVLLCSVASAAPTNPLWVKRYYTTTEFRADEGRTSDTRSITPVAFKVFTLPPRQCPPCDVLKGHIARYPGVKITYSKQRRCHYKMFPTVLYSDGWVDNGERIYHGQYQLYPTLKPQIEFVEVSE